MAFSPPPTRLVALAEWRDAVVALFVNDRLIVIIAAVIIITAAALNVIAPPRIQT